MKVEVVVVVVDVVIFLCNLCMRLKVRLCSYKGEQ